MANLAADLVQPIREGTFPNSPSVLSADVDSTVIESLLESIQSARAELSAEIREAGRPFAAGVDDWIAKAKKVQADIAQCRQDAQNIVQEHDRLSETRAEAAEHKRKAALLSNEINFNESLQKQLQSISNVYERLKTAETMLADDNLLELAHVLRDVLDQTTRLQGPRARTVIAEYSNDLHARTRRRLETILLDRITVAHQTGQLRLDIQTTPTFNLSGTDLMIALDALDAADGVCETVADRLDAVIAYSLSVRKSRLLTAHQIEEQSLSVTTGSSHPPVQQILSFSSDLVSFLHASLPEALFKQVSEHLGARLSALLVTDWLTPAIPSNLDELSRLDALGADVAGLIKTMEQCGWPNSDNLRQWTRQAPRMWIGKRKADALDAVRRAFVISSGNLHQVERVERQTVQHRSNETTEPPQDASDDWNTGWDDDEKAPDEPKNDADDDTSGWGFDDDAEDEQNQPANGRDTNKPVDDQDPEDAWGWDEDDAEKTQDGTGNGTTQKSQPNGGQQNVSGPEEMVLTEFYSITDIPDYVLEGIGRDIQDGLRLREEDHASLKDVPASSGLFALPSLSLAMFRATAATYYAKRPQLGNMNLYNDALYIADKMRQMNVPTGMKDVEADCVAMARFARSAYAREREMQQTILSDLLDGVQGFTIPYTEQIEDAVAATCDRLRQVYAEWKPILSTSHLMQSIGSLLASVLGKVITEIEEIDDISEAQSQRLGKFCAQLAELEDLFLTTPPDGGEPFAATALYTSNWLRFQYLTQILEASLADIKFLWTEGELSLEFSAEEVIDLIKALFAESSHRRSAIAAIRGHRSSGL
jgi:protein transport protein DSL1/ZW10